MTLFPTFKSSSAGFAIREIGERRRKGEKILRGKMSLLIGGRRKEETACVAAQWIDEEEKLAVSICHQSLVRGIDRRVSGSSHLQMEENRKGTKGLKRDSGDAL